MLQRSSFEYTPVLHALTDQPWEVDRSVDADGGELLSIIDTWWELVAREIVELCGLVKQGWTSLN
jgi:hypothetical protein